MVFQAGAGSLSGALVGGLIQGVTSAAQGNNFWDGSSATATNAGQPQAKRTKAEVVRANQEAHKQSVQEARKILESAGGQDISTEVSFVSEGTRVRVDLAAKIDNTPVLIEVKSSLSAGLTPNQQIVYPRILLMR